MNEFLQLVIRPFIQQGFTEHLICSGLCVLSGNPEMSDALTLQWRSSWKHLGNARFGEQNL